MESLLHTLLEKVICPFFLPCRVWADTTFHYTFSNHINDPRPWAFNTYVYIEMYMHTPYN